MHLTAYPISGQQKLHEIVGADTEEVGVLGAMEPRTGLRRSLW
jgi:hypothetical protein